MRLKYKEEPRNIVGLKHYHSEGLTDVSLPDQINFEW